MRASFAHRLRKAVDALLAVHESGTDAGVERASRNIGCALNAHCEIYPVRDAARRVSVRLRCEADRVARLTAIHPANIKESAIDRDHDRDHDRDAAQRLHSTHLPRSQRLSLVWDQ